MDMPVAPPSPPLALDEVIPFPAMNAWVRAALHCQFNINPYMMASGLKIGSNGMPEINRRGLVQLMVHCATLSAPKNHFPLLAGEFFAFDYAPAIETYLTTSATLRDALPILGWVSSLFKDLDLAFDERGEQSAIVITLPLYSEEHVRVRGYFVELITAIILKFIRLILGVPEIGIRVEMEHDPGPQKSICEKYYGTPILTNRQQNALLFETKWLDLKLPGFVPDLHREAQQIIEQQIPTSFEVNISSQIEKLLLRHPELMGKGIDRIALRLNLHPRTLQRRLQQDGVMYCDILSRCRYEVAASVLKSEDCNIESLSKTLGFSDRHSFTRAFKRWTGLSPREFNRQFIEQLEQSQSL